MLIIKYFLLVTVVMPFSLLLAIISGITRFFGYVGILNRVTAMKCGPYLYSIAAKWLCTLLGIPIPTVPIKNGSFIVANHVSWLDGFVFAAAHRCTIVTKSELSSLFYIGFLLKNFGSIPVDDNPSSVLNAINMCHQYLENGISVLVFPEGTTGSQHSLGHFHSLFFEVPIKQCQPVCIAAINYNVGSSSTGFPCWIGSEYLLHNINRVLSILHHGVTVKLGLSEIPSADMQRNELAKKSRNLVASLLGISVEIQHNTNEITQYYSIDELDIENSHALSIIKDILIEYWVSEGLMDSTEIDIDKTFTQLHIDSLGIVTLGIELERRIGQSMSIKTAVLYDTPRKLAYYLDGLNNS